MLPIGNTSGMIYAEFSPDGKKIVTTYRDGRAKILDAETYNLLADLVPKNNVGQEMTYLYVEGEIVNPAFFSPDGKKIVTASWDGSAKIWDAKSGTLLVDLKLDHGLTLNAPFSPDSKRIITISSDSTAKIWDVQSGTLLFRLKGHSDRITFARFSPDNRNIVTASNDKTAKIWNAETGKLLIDLKGHLSWVVSAQFSSDGKEIVTASWDGTAKIWNARTGKQLANLIGDNGGLKSAQFSPDGKKVQTIYNDQTTKTWDAETGKILLDIEGNDNRTYFVLFSKDGKRVFRADQSNGSAELWDAESGKLLIDRDKSMLYFAPGQIVSANFSSDSQKIAIIGPNDEKIFDTRTGSLLFDFGKRRQSMGVYDAMFCQDDKRIFTTDDHYCKIWDSEKGSLLFTLKECSKTIYFSQLSFDGSKGIIVYADSTAKIWDTETGRDFKNLIGKKSDYITYGEFSSDGKKTITTANNSNIIKIWDTETGKVLSNISCLAAIHSSQLSHEGKKVIATCGDSTVKIWEAETGKFLVNLKGHTKLVNSAQFSPDDQKIITASDDATAKVWDAEAGTLLTSLRCEKAVKSAQFSPDGKMIATVSTSNTKIWDSLTGKLIFSWNGRWDWTNFVQFSSNSKKVLTDSGQTAKIWDAHTGKLLTSLRGHDKVLRDAQFSADGKKVVTSSLDHTCKVWDAESGKLLYTFIAIDSTDYLVTDPYGRYDGTEAARKLLYFTCGAEAISLDQVKDQLWVPNLVERINKGDSINAKKLSDLDICGLIPHVEREDRSGYHFIITPQRGGLGETVLSVNGIEVRRYKPTQLVQTAAGFELNIPEQELAPYFIAGQQNPVTVKAYTAMNDISSRMAQAMEDETAKKAEIPNLYAVMIGVSDYKSPELQLKYAAKDAGDISKAVASSARKLLNTDGKEHVYMYNLTTDKEHYQLPEKIAIHRILDEIGKKTTANDILLIFFAGHGVSSGERKQFYFLTADASQATATDATAEVGISTKELSDWMKPSIIKAQKRILILDACNSGQAIKEMVKIGDSGQNYVAARNDDKSEQIKAIDKLNERSGLFILAASASNQNAYEMGRYSQGLLTYALLKAIKQEPDILEDNKYLNVSRWFNAAEKTVSDIVRQTGNRQEPQIVSAGNFNIGLVDQEVMAGIKLADEKPLFTASNFQNSDEDVVADNLQLNSILDNLLNEISARGEENPITYVAGSSSPDAYSLVGRYDVKGDDLAVKVNIRQNNQTKYKFELSGKKSNLKDLAEQVVTQATDWIVKHK